MTLFTPFPVVVVPEGSVERILKAYPNWALLSIRSVDVPLAVHTTGLRLNLVFDDVTHPSPVANWWTPPSITDAEKIAEFARALARTPPSGLVVHCAAGLSRSTAATVGIGTVLFGSAGEGVSMMRAAVKLAYKRGWRGDKDSFPNELLVEHLDRALGCTGSMVAAVKAYANRRGA